MSMGIHAGQPGSDAACFDWNEVRFVLAIARAGSMVDASTVLGVDQTTVSRRLRGLEQALGTPLFERHRGRMRPTGAGLQVIEHGSRIEREMVAIHHVVADTDAQVRGVTRVTAVDTLVTHYLSGLVGPARCALPTLSIELIATNHNLDLARREADIAIRLARPTEGDLVARRLGELGMGVFGRADRVGDSLCFDPEVPWLTYDRDMMSLPEMAWLAQRIRPSAVVFRSNCIDALARAAVDGVGLVVLPRVVGAAHPALRCMPFAVPGRDIWMVIARELRDLPRVRVLADWLVQRFAADDLWLRDGLRR